MTSVTNFQWETASDWFSNLMGTRGDRRIQKRRTYSAGPVSGIREN